MKKTRKKSKLVDKPSGEISRFFAIFRYIYYIIAFLFAMAFTIESHVAFHVPLFIFYILTYLVGLFSCLKVYATLEMRVIGVGFLYSIMNTVGCSLIFVRLHLHFGVALLLLNIENGLWLVTRYVKLKHLVLEVRKIG